MIAIDVCFFLDVGFFWSTHENGTWKNFKNLLCMDSEKIFFDFRRFFLIGMIVTV